MVAAFHFSSFGGKALDRAFFDAASRHPLHPAPVPTQSALVLVDDASMEKLSNDVGMRWPFPRAAFAGLIAALNRAGAERILMDFTFLEHSEAEEQDFMLAATAVAVPGTVLGRTQGRGPVFWDPKYLSAHPDFFRRPRTGATDYLPDDDGVMRAYPAAGSLAAAGFDPPDGSTGGLLRWRGGLEQIRARQVPVVPAGNFIEAGLPIVDRLSQQAPDFSPEGFAKALASEPKLTGGVFDLVRGRTVFVGTNASGTFDLKQLPVGKLEPGVLLHWTAWTDLAQHDFITEVPRWVSLVAAALVGALMLVLAGRWPGLTVPAVAALGFVILLLPVAYAGLSSGWFFAPATPAAAALLTLLGVAAESFWTERARKREIQAMFGAYGVPCAVEQLVRKP